MKKDAYYFPHDSNAKDDPDCMILIEELGLEGYGIFWVLVETLRDQENYKAPLKIIPGLARRYNTTSEKMKAVVVRYNLFIIEEEAFFYSEALIKKMEPLKRKRKIKRVNGIKGNLIKHGHATKQQLAGLSDDEILQLEELRKDQKSHNKLNSPHFLGCESGASRVRVGGESHSDRKAVASKGKESKGKESKGKKSKKEECVLNYPPTLEDVEKYFHKNGGLKQKAARFFNHYTSTGWKTKAGHAIHNWKTRAQMWIDEDKTSNQNQGEATGQNVPTPPSNYRPVQEDSGSYSSSQFELYKARLRDECGLSKEQVDELKLTIDGNNYEVFLELFDEVMTDRKSTDLDPEDVFHRLITPLTQN